MQTDVGFQKDLKTYKNEIKSKLICKSKVSKRFVEDLHNNIDNYIADNNVTAIEDVYSHFGTADDIANAFFETVDIKTVRKKICIKKLIAVLVAAVIVIVATGVTVAVIDFNNTNALYGVFGDVVEEAEINDY